MPGEGGALILAAGVSRRFGSDKRRHRLENGSTMLLTTISIYRQIFERVVVVVRPEDAIEEDVRGLFSDVRCVSAPLAHLGMGHSLAAGVATLGDWNYAFVALADMPNIHPDTLRLLRARMEQSPTPVILQPVYAQQSGHPVGFHRAYFPELEKLTGDMGAREVIAQHRGELIRLDTDDSGVIEDFDTPTQCGV